MSPTVKPIPEWSSSMPRAAARSSKAKPAAAPRFPKTRSRVGFGWKKKWSFATRRSWFPSPSMSNQSAVQDASGSATPRAGATSVKVPSRRFRHRRSGAGSPVEVRVFT